MWFSLISAMVCSQGESLTHHTNQMKLFNAIAATAVIATSFVTAQEFAQMTGQDMGDMASVHLNMDTGKEIRANDGSNVLSITRDGQSYAIRPDSYSDKHSEALEMPVKRLFSGYGANQKVGLSKYNAHAASKILRNGGFDNQDGRLQRVGPVNLFNQANPF